MDLQAEIGRVHRQLAADVANLRTADDAVAAGSRAMEAGDIKTALTSFEKAAEAVPACQRAIVQADACRRHLEELQRKRDETHALIAEAQKSARLGDWSAVVALCDKALTLDRHVTEASGLRSQAVRALEVEATERKRAAETAAQREEAFKYAQAAETALDDREPERAFALAKQALAIDPSLTLARKIHGLASARLTAEAEAKARATAAVERLREARVLVSKGKYKKAREAVAAAAALNPNNAEVAGALAEISALEARADEERERAQLAEERAHTIAPILASARTAEAQRDFVRAAWTAENVLAIDLDCAEARLILKRSREALAAQPALADETVDERSGADPDGTVTLVPITLWSRVVLALRSIGGGRSRRERASAR
jgi:tetratricopeptide (TPR) repeat protein